MDKNIEAFRKRFLAYKNGKAVSEIYDAGLPKYVTGAEGFDDTIEFLKQYEGFKNSVYKDANDVPTIGYGFTDPTLVKRGKISRSEADVRLVQELVNRDRFLSKLNNWDKLGEGAKTALRSYYYNYPAGFKEATKFMKAWNAGNYSEAIRQVDAGWNDVKNPGLRTRRQVEQQMLREDPFLMSTMKVPEVKPAPIVNVPVSTAVRQTIPAEQTIARWSGAEDLSTYLTGRPLPRLQPIFKLPTIREAIEDSMWKPGYKNGKKPITTGGAGYIPNVDIIQALKDHAYKSVTPIGYTFENVKNFFKKKYGNRMYSDPNTEALWGKYNNQDSIIANSTQAPEGMQSGKKLTKKDILNLHFSPEDSYVTDLAKYSVKDIIIPSKSKKGAYEFAYPNKKGNVKHIPDNANGVPSESWLHSNQLGSFRRRKGSDKNGTYITYEDDWSINPFRGVSSSDDSTWKWFIDAGKAIGLDEFRDLIPFGSPFEIYGKQYYNDDGTLRYRDGKSPIHIKPSKRGSFTAAAKRRGMTVSQLESAVLKNPSKYSKAMRKKA